MLATANTGKIGRSFGKDAGEWTGGVEIGKEASTAPHCKREGDGGREVEFGGHEWRIARVGLMGKD